jgi:hypothetical protein
VKKVLCISPHFPPVNGADMHRLRQSLPYFREFGWDPVVFAVNPNQIEMAQDPLLLESIPDDIAIHHVGAAPAKLTRRAGLGNLGFRSWFPLRRAVARYLQTHHVDLIYFTTTVFTSIAHAPYWKQNAGVPFVVDLQDPWRNDYYLNLPPSQRPRKFWFDHAQKKRLEAHTMPQANGLIAVSEAYIDTMRERYPVLRNVPALTLPFAAATGDFDIARQLPSRRADDGFVRIVYVGRGGRDMGRALETLFSAVARLKAEAPELVSRLRFEFIGTSYAKAGHGLRTMSPVAKRFGLSHLVSEMPGRLPYFEALRTLLDADVLFIPGSDDAAYTASKIFPYILAKRPLFAIFHEQSSAAHILREISAGEVLTFGTDISPDVTVEATQLALRRLLKALPFQPATDWARFERYSAREMTKKCCQLFDRVIDSHHRAGSLVRS